MKDREAWHAAVHGVAKSWLQLSDRMTTTIKDFRLDQNSSSDSKASACKVGDLGLIPGLGRYPGEGTGNPLQYSCLENSMDRGTWQTTVHGVTESDTTKQLTLSLFMINHHHLF